MHGYEVVTSDERVVGRVVDVRHGFLIVESGRLRKSRRPVPREFVHPVDEEARAVVTAPKSILMDAPKMDKDGGFDRDEAARHYGLAESYLRPSGEGTGEPLPDDPPSGGGRDPATGEPAPERERAEIRKHMRPELPAEHDRGSPALLGDRRIDDRRVDEG
ncbi:MAG: hypothetical protein ACM3QU_03130 [Verrucomicrobiota bacterium]